MSVNLFPRSMLRIDHSYEYCGYRGFVVGFEENENSLSMQDVSGGFNGKDEYFREIHVGIITFSS